MRNRHQISVIIPALDEERAIGRVVSAIPDWVDDIVVVDNGSRDRTSAVAAAAGARVILQRERGYGAACIAGIAALNGPDIIVFIDGDCSDEPAEMALLVDPIAADEADIVVGSRVRGRREPGSLTIQQRLGNWLACRLVNRIWGAQWSDLGPFRAIRADALSRLNMQDRRFGWTVEMQLKAAAAGLRMQERAVSYRPRIGESKISGTVRGAILAGCTILMVIARSAFNRQVLAGRTTTKEPGRFA